MLVFLKENFFPLWILKKKKTPKTKNTTNKQHHGAHQGKNYVLMWQLVLEWFLLHHQETSYSLSAGISHFAGKALLRLTTK